MLSFITAGRRAEAASADIGGGSGSGGAAVKKKKSGFAAFWSDFGYLIVTAVVVVLVFRVLLQLSWVPSGSMETTIPKKTLLISWQLPYVMGDPVPERGNIVTFWSDELDKLLVKRVIGLPGDTVSFSGGYVYINGQRLEEEYLDQQGGTISPDQSSFTVPEGCLFFLGDNRSGSNDARYWEESYIPVGNVKARVLLAISLTGGSSWQGVRAYWKKVTVGGKRRTNCPTSALRISLLSPHTSNFYKFFIFLRLCQNFLIENASVRI